MRQQYGFVARGLSMSVDEVIAGILQADMNIALRGAINVKKTFPEAFWYWDHTVKLML